MRTYDNPVLGGFHPDPSVCRVGEDYYLACSSFEYFPGIPIFHSRDLVHWRQIGNALDRPGQLRLPPATAASGGVFAPTLRHHDGRFYLVDTNVSDRGNFIVSAARPEGPWSDPVWIDLPGVDPDLAWDEDGSCWCATSGVNLARIDPETGKVLEGPFPTWSGTGLQWPEAPHLYHVGEWWYLMNRRGQGTDRGARRLDRARPLAARPVRASAGEPDPVPTRSTDPADPVHRPRRPRAGRRRDVVDGAARHPAARAHPGFHVLGAGDVPGAGRVAGTAGPSRARYSNGIRRPPPGTRFPPAPVAGRLRRRHAGPVLDLAPLHRPEGSWSLTERAGSLTPARHRPDARHRPGCTFVGRTAATIPTAGHAPASTRDRHGRLSVRMDEAPTTTLGGGRGWERRGSDRPHRAGTAVRGRAARCRRHRSRSHLAFRTTDRSRPRDRRRPPRALSRAAERWPRHDRFYVYGQSARRAGRPVRRHGRSPAGFHGRVCGMYVYEAGRRRPSVLVRLRARSGDQESAPGADGVRQGAARQGRRARWSVLATFRCPHPVHRPPAVRHHVVDGDDRRGSPGSYGHVGVSPLRHLSARPRPRTLAPSRSRKARRDRGWVQAPGQ
ncbi:family 43 glycosylhydrolase, partial [Nonomuraea rubra]|uniref:family 43 glycosylhydrolase n=1 Tax=Nonomuraea rubra TaxID=46180 RepID=UPI003CD06E70